MKNRVIVVGFFVILMVFAVFLMFFQISHFGGLTGYVVFDDSLGNEVFSISGIVIIIALALVLEILLVLVFKIRGKKHTYEIEHDLR